MSITVKTPAGEFAYSPYPSLSDLMMTRDKLERGVELDEIDRDRLARIGIQTKKKTKRKKK